MQDVFNNKYKTEKYYFYEIYCIFCEKCIFLLIKIGNLTKLHHLMKKDNKGVDIQAPFVV